MTRLAQWAIFAASILAMGAAFLWSPFRKDERWFFADNFGLDSRRGDPDDGKDSMHEAWAALRASPSLHNLKNIAHEWARESPKRAVKFLCFLLILGVIL
jgi:hypothetical protein